MRCKRGVGSVNLGNVCQGAEGDEVDFAAAGGAGAVDELRRGLIREYRVIVLERRAHVAQAVGAVNIHRSM